MTALIDIIGRRAGRLVVIERDGCLSNRPAFLCRCDCGEYVTVRGSEIRDDNGTRSCGCLSREVAGSRFRTHGNSSHPYYYRWKQMWQRCTNPNNEKYPEYGGRGIRVCDRWASFENFLEDVPEIPDGMSIDRIDTDGDYEPGNIRIATASEQRINQRRMSA